MTDPRLHQGLGTERWHRLSLQQQLGNLGSEVGRVLLAYDRGDSERLEPALDRALELFDLTLADPRLQGRRKEICRAREVLLDLVAGTNEYGSTTEAIDRYFTQFGTAARLQV